MQWKSVVSVVGALVLGAPVVAALPLPGATPAAAAVQGSAAATDIAVTSLNFRVRVGPDDATVCNVVGDIYRPIGASSRRPVPAVLTTNGFGGSKADQAPMARLLAAKGYVVLSYSGLGFGGSDCKITLDDPDWDGKAASQLVSYLGGKTGIAFFDAEHTRPAPALRTVRRDSRDHSGRARAHDPRVGMIGGSYGGQVQFAVAGIDSRVDALVPSITWNDLSYSLAPNNLTAEGSSAVSSGVSSEVTGAVKLVWGLGFSGLGVVAGLENAQTDPGRLLPCPNFADLVCPALVSGAVTGGFDDASIAGLRHASVASYVEDIRIPVLIIQGQNDTLFNLNEAVATYTSLRRQGTPVKMIWQWSGHSMGTPAPGEADRSRPSTADYITGRTVDWLERFLKDRRISTGPRFAWFRNWIDYSGSAEPAYGTAGGIHPGSSVPLHLSGTGLVRDPDRITPGQQSLLTPVAGLPTSLEPLDAIGALGTAPPLPEADLPGTTATWTSAALSRPYDVVGSPTLRVQLEAPVSAITGGLGAIGGVVLFARLVDVAPDGGTEVVRDLVAPFRVTDLSAPVTVTLPAVVHRFAPGHRIQLVLAGGSTNYRGNTVANAVTVRTGSADQVLTLPVVR